MDSGFDCGNEEPSSNPSKVRYIHLRANTLVNVFISPTAISKNQDSVEACVGEFKTSSTRNCPNVVSTTTPLKTTGVRRP